MKSLLNAALRLTAAALFAAGTVPAGAAGLSVTPAAVATGHAARVTVHLPGATADTQQALAPWQPQIEARLKVPRQAFAIAAAGAVVAAAGKGGLTLLDAAAPSVLARFPVDDTCTKVRIHSGTVYMACNVTGLWLIDITRPAAPAALATIKTAVTDFAVGGRYLYVLAGVTLTAYDVAAPAAPVKDAYVAINAPVHSLGADGDQVFVTEGPAGVAAYRLDNDNALRSQGRFRTRTAAGAIIVNDGLAYVALRGSGILVLDVAQPGEMRWIGSYHRLGQVIDMRVTDAAAYVLSAGGVVYRIDDRHPDRLSVEAALRISGGPARDLAVGRHDRLWVLVGDGLDRVDFSRAAPAYSNETFDVGEGVNFGGIRRGVIVGNTVYVADWFSGIHLFDISRPDHPRLIASFHTQGSPKGIAVRDGYAYVAADDHGLRVIDVRDPRHMRLIGSLITPGLAYTPVLDGSRLYLAGHRGGFQIIDISRPAHPRLLGGYDTPSKAWSLRVRRGIAYVADDAAGLEVFDVRDPAHIRRLGGFDPGGDAEDVVLDGGHALVTFFDKGLYVLDISDPAQPRAIGHLQVPGNARGIEIHGDKAYLADWLAGLHVVDISDLRHPRILGGYDTDGAAWGVRVKGRYAYVMDWWGGFIVLDVADPTRPRLAARYHDRGHVHQIITRGKFIYVAYGRGGLQVFDIKNPLNPIWVTGIDEPDKVTGLWLQGNHLYTVSDGGGLTIVDASNPYEIATVARLDMHLHHPRVRGDGRDRLYVSDPDQGVMIMDVSRPDHPQRTALIGTQATALWQMGTTLYVAGGDAVQAYDVTDPGRPIARSMWRAAGPVTALCGAGGVVYAAVKGHGIAALTTAGGALHRGAVFPLRDEVADLTAAGGHLFATQLHGGLWDFAIDAAGALHSAAFYPILHPSTRVSTAGDTAYIAGGTTPTAVAWQPGMAWSPGAAGTQTLTLPDKLPRGDYDVLQIAADGGRRVFPDALKVTLPRRVGPPFTMQDFEKALQKMQREREQGQDTP